MYKNLGIVHLKEVDFVLCKLDLKKLFKQNPGANEWKEPFL